MDNLSERIRGEIEKVLAFDMKRLIERPEWGAINMKRGEQELNSIFDLTHELSSLPIESLPSSAKSELLNRIAKIATLLGKIDGFSIERPDHRKMAESLIDEIKNENDSLHSLLGPWIGYLAFHSNRGAQQKLTDLENIVKTAKEKLEGSVNEAKELLEAMRQASAQTGVAVFAATFKQEADEYAKAAKKWLLAATVGAVLTMAAATFLWLWTEPGLDQGQIFQKLSTKIVVLALLFSATMWCGRVYKALKHLEAINRHRSVSIQTLKAFVQATSDEHSKNAVIMEAARAVFGPVTTGFVEQPGSGEGDVKVVEWVRGLTQRQ